MSNSNDTPQDDAPPGRSPIGGDQVGGDKLTAGDIASSTVAIGTGANVTAHHYYYPPVSPPLDRQQLRNREAMLKKVRLAWIDGVLNKSLFKEARLTLDLAEREGAVQRPYEVVRRWPDQQDSPLPAGTRIVDVFDAQQGALLILGAPGSDKTTLLLELARDLLDRTAQDEAHLIPVVFNLSSWVEKRQPLEMWLIDELNRQYDVPQRLARAWVDSDTVLLLLDGLDEVAPEYRSKCAQAINAFRQEHGFLPLVVCCRLAEYEALPELRLHGAVVAQPLTQTQVKQYLQESGAPLAGLRAALRDDPALWELMDSPLLLSIVVLTYKNTSAPKLRASGTPEQRRRQIFDDYVTAMFKRPGRSKRDALYTPPQTIRWLNWLARGMQRQGQSVFLIERLQPDWLLSSWERQQYMLLDRWGFGLIGGLVGGLVCGLGFRLVGGLYDRLDWGLGGGLGLGLAGGLFFGLYDWVAWGLVVGLVIGLVSGLFGGTVTRLNSAAFTFRRIATNTIIGGLVVGLIGGLVVGLVVGLVSGPRNGLFGGLFAGLVGALVGGLAGILNGSPSTRLRWITVVERLQWAWPKAGRAALGGSLGFGLVSGLVVGLVGGLGFGLRSGLVLGPAGGLVGGLIGGLESREVTLSTAPNQGIRRSANSALLIGLVGGLCFGLEVGLFGGAAGGLVGGLAGGTAVGLAFGGYACLSHLALRLVFWRCNAMPLNYVRFLDSCADRILLRKVGGGYIFVHRLLLEYFASLDESASPKESS